MGKPEKIHDRTTSDLPINSVVSVVIVDDPYSSVGEKIQVLRSLRGDPLASLYAKHHIDDAQLRAGRQWQSYYEQSEIGGMKAIDPTKEAVDGGGLREILTDTQMRAFRELARADLELDRFTREYQLILDGKWMIRMALGLRCSIASLAHSNGLMADRQVKTVGRDFRSCLERLAIYWGFAQEKHRLVY